MPFALFRYKGLLANIWMNPQSPFSWIYFAFLPVGWGWPFPWTALAAYTYQAERAERLAFSLTLHFNHHCQGEKKHLYYFYNILQQMQLVQTHLKKIFCLPFRMNQGSNETDPTSLPQDLCTIQAGCTGTD